MKKILPILSVLILLTSCVKYAQPPLLSLSGLYAIDKIKVGDVDVNTFADTNDIIVPTIDTTIYSVNDTIFEMDYSVIRFNPIQGGLDWENEYFYYANGQRNVYDYGYIKFDCPPTRRIWKIIDDGTESLVLRIPPNENGEYIMLYLTRIGP